MKHLYIAAAAATFVSSACVFAQNDPNNAPNAPTATLPVVAVKASDPVAFRGLSSGAFVLHRDRTNGDLAVNIVLSGSATNGTDYTTIPTSVTIPAGFYSLGLPVNPLGVALSVPDRTAILTIETSAAYRVGHASHASVEIEANLYEDQAPVVTITDPADNTSVGVHSDVLIKADASDPNDSIQKVSFYAGDRFLGSSTSTPFSLTWSNVPAGSFSLFARAEDQFGKSTLSTAVHLTVTNPPPSSNIVALTTPTAGSLYAPGANITLAATVTGPDAVKSVSFYSGDTLLGTDDTPPYSFDWNNVAPGRYTLRAKATETDGAVSTSASVKITVTNDLPTVTITSPTNTTVLAGPTDVTITATASDSDDSVAKVTFHGDTKSLGSVTTAPYTVKWTNVPPGKHMIIATATDAFGALKSTAITITITNPPPVVSVTSPTNNASFTAPATIELKVDATDADGVQNISFWSGDHRLGADATPPYSFTVTNLEAGTYIFRAHAVDIYGDKSVSDPVTVTVKP